MEVKVDRTAKFEVKVHTEAPECRTLDDFDHMISVLFHEGVPRDATAAMYADRNGTVVFNHISDETPRLKATLEALREYIEDARADTNNANGEEDLVFRINEILEML